jgi:hypothetical protein
MPDPTPAPAPDNTPAPAAAAAPAEPNTPAPADPNNPAPAGDPTPAPAAADPTAPATFEGLTLADGFTLAQEDFGALEGVFKEANIPLTGGLAQKLIDLEQSRMARLQESATAAQEEQVKAWEAASRADKEFGGDKFDANLTAAQEALDALATPELRDLLQKSGMGNHPEMLRLFVKLAPLVREPGAGGGRQMTPAATTDRASRLYGEA